MMPNNIVNDHLTNVVKGLLIYILEQQQQHAIRCQCLGVLVTIHTIPIPSYVYHVAMLNEAMMIYIQLKVQI